MADYEPTKWWKVLDPNGGLWCETSSEKEARNSLRPGDRLFHMYQKIEYRWDEIDPSLFKNIVEERIARGCPNCGKPWVEKDLESNFPALGMACSVCYDG